MIRTPSSPLLPLALTLALLTCGDPVAPSGSSIRVVSGTLRDTISAVHQLRVIVGRGGALTRGVEVRFQTRFDQLRVLVRRMDDSVFRLTAVDTTDLMGGVSVRTQHGFAAGQGGLVVSVPALGYVDTLTFTVDPGNAVGVRVAPADTALYAGREFSLRPHAVDRFNNPRVDLPFQFSLVYGPATVTAAGDVATTSIGRAVIAVRSGQFRDTAYVSVVPEAWVATQKFYAGNGGPEGIFLMQLDGSGRDSLTSGLNNSHIPHGFAWSPDGWQLALTRSATLYLLEPGGTEQPLVTMAADLNTAARFSRDGQWVYFALGSGRGFYRVRRDGTGLEHIRGDSAFWGDDYFVQPSHDGQSVAYTSTRTPCGVDSCIRVMDLAAKQDRIYGTQDYLVRGAMAAWSPVEGLIAYNTGREVRLVRADGTPAGVVASDAGYVKWMDWSPDGRWLIVSGDFGVALFDVQSNLRLPIAHLLSYSATNWRP